MCIQQFRTRSRKVSVLAWCAGLAAPRISLSGSGAEGGSADRLSGTRVFGEHRRSTAKVSVQFTRIILYISECSRRLELILSECRQFQMNTPLNSEQVTGITAGARRC